MKKNILLIAIIGLLNLFIYWKFSVPKFLTFSDGAKIADIARNIEIGKGYGSTFSSFGADRNILFHLKEDIFPAWGRQPLMSYTMSLFFRIFGSNDLGVIATSITLYIAIAISIFLLANKLFDRKIALLSSIVFLFVPSFWEYAINGASETLFTLEIILTFLLLASKNKKISLFGVIFSFLAYFTRPQGFILILSAFIYYSLNNSKTIKVALSKILIVIILGVLIDLTLFANQTGKSFFYSILSKGSDVSVLYTSEVPATSGLRTIVDNKSILINNLPIVGKKIFYNVYNILKLMPNIMPYFIFISFVISVFFKEEDQNIYFLRISTAFMFILGILSTAISIPFFRYLHPYIPLLIIFGIPAISKIIKNNYFLYFILFLFAILQGLGVLFLDSRFILRTKNLNKPPLYVLASRVLKNDTLTNEIVVTNLDTWGSWYGDRKTVWFPTEPDAINNNQFDLIYLVSYKIDDENYYMGEKWREIFFDPKEQKIINNYEFIKEYTFKADETYEKQDGRAVLLRKKQVK